MLQQMGVTVPPGISMQLKNVAAVMVTATLPAFAQPGQVIDVTVSSLGNAKSLRGGTLIAHAAEGRRRRRSMRMAQGNLIVGGAGASAAARRCRSTTSRPAACRRARPSSAPCRRRCAQGEFAAARPQQPPTSPPRATWRARSTTAKGERHRAARSTAASCACACRRRPDARVAFLADIENLAVALAQAGRQGRAQRAHRLGGDERSR